MSCPICDGEMTGGKQHWDNWDYINECLNGCFAEEFAYGNTRYYIFGIELDERECSCQDAIDYWKKDFRYLMKILEKKK